VYVFCLFTQGNKTLGSCNCSFSLHETSLLGVRVAIMQPHIIRLCTSSPESYFKAVSAAWRSYLCPRTQQTINYNAHSLRLQQHSVHQHIQQQIISTLWYDSNPLMSKIYARSWRQLNWHPARDPVKTFQRGPGL